MIDTDHDSGEQYATATALADIATGQTGPVELDGETVSACACGCCHRGYRRGDRIDLYRPSADRQWHIAGKTDDPL